MEISYGNKGIDHFLDVNMGVYSELNENNNMYQLRMLEENNIAYLLKPISTELDGKLFLKYNTGSDYVMERIMLRMKPDGEFLRNIMSQLFECIRSLGQYLLIPDDIVLEPSYMFYNCNSKELKLVYIPGYGKDIRVQIKGLLEYIMRIFDHRDGEGVQYMYSLYDWVADEGADISAWINFRVSKGDYNYDLSENVYRNASEDAGVNNMRLNTNRRKNKEILENVCVKDASVGIMSKKNDSCADMNGKTISDVEHENNVKNKKCALRELVLIVNTVAVGIAAVGYFVYQLKWAAIAGVILIVLLAIQLISKICNMDDDADEAMAEYAANATWNSSATVNDFLPSNSREGTLEMVGEQEWKKKNSLNNVGVHRLVPLNNGSLDTMSLDAYQEKIVIGRGRKGTDYRVPTTQISRVHACIYLRNDGVYLEDQNSANGTYINAVRLPGMQAQILSGGDIVSFANEEFFVS